MKRLREVFIIELPGYSKRERCEKKQRIIDNSCEMIKYKGWKEKERENVNIQKKCVL